MDPYVYAPYIIPVINLSIAFPCSWCGCRSSEREQKANTKSWNPFYPQRKERHVKENPKAERGKTCILKPRSSVKLKKKNDFVTAIIMSILTGDAMRPISAIVVGGTSAAAVAISNITRRFLHGSIHSE